MSIEIGPVGYTAQARFEPARAPKAAGAPVDPLASLPEIDRLELSSMPPPEVRAEVEFAYSRALELAARNRELHFAQDEKTGRVCVQVRDLDGNVIRTILSSEVFDVMAEMQAATRVSRTPSSSTRP